MAYFAHPDPQADRRKMMKSRNLFMVSPLILDVLPYQLAVMYAMSSSNFLIHALASSTVEVNLSTQSTSPLGSSSVNET